MNVRETKRIKKSRKESEKVLGSLERVREFDTIWENLEISGKI